MDPQSGIATKESPRPVVRDAAVGAMPYGVAPATILLLAVWIGLVAGSLDLGFMVVSRLLDGDFYRLGDQFVWMIPLGVAALILVPAAMLALLARILRRNVHVSLAVGLLSFIGFLDLCAR